uniref:Protein IQ-DOMAIN 32 n=1 Tax=Anthurium amnicola TaxID=1678845 RepID=A0A1D1YPP0_9ARAE
MGKSRRSCFNIMTCSRDAADYDDLELLESRAFSDGRRWSFQKHSSRKHVPSNSVTSEPPAIDNDKESPEISHIISCPPEDSISSEEISSPKTTDEMPQLSLETVDSKVGDSSHATEKTIKPDPDVKESAAVMIQAAIRKYLARKEIQKLKSVIKLQATIRGHLVRRQAAGTLRCVQAIVKMQTLVQVHFVCQSVGNSANQRKLAAIHKESTGAKHKKTYSLTEKLLTNGFTRKFLESTPKTRPIHIDCDPSRSDSAWKWLERWMALAGSDIGQQEELNLTHVHQDEGTSTKLGVSKAPISMMDECSSLPLKDYQGCHQPRNETLNVTQQNHTKNEATKENYSLNSSEIIPQSASVSQAPGTMFDKPDLEKGKLNHSDGGVKCESLESECKSVMEIKKVCNPAFVSAQPKFKEQCSTDSINTVCTCYQNVSNGARLENSPLDSFTKDSVTSAEDSVSHVPGGVTTTSECGTKLSISSTLNLLDRSEAEGGKIVHEIGPLEWKNFNANGGSNDAYENLNSETKNSSGPEILQPPKVEAINRSTTDLTAAVESVQIEQQPSLEQHQAEPISSDMQVHQENVIDQKAYRSSPEGSPRRSHITALESCETPSSQISLDAKKSNNENDMHAGKQRSQFVGKRSLSDLNNDSARRSSTEHLPKSSRNGERRNSFGIPNSNSLPSYMQTTESARAKAHVNNSPRSSLDVHDNDSYTRKMKQSSSPHMQQSSSQMQQNAKGSAPRSPCNSAERRWQR